MAKKEVTKAEEVKAEKTAIEEGPAYEFKCADPKEAKSLKIMYGELITKALDVIDAMNTGKTNKELKAVKKVAKAAQDAYNHKLAEAYYRSLAKSAGLDAVKVAIENLNVPGAIVAQYKTDEEERAYLAIGDLTLQISLVDMMQTIGKKYFAGENWFGKIQMLSLVIATNLHRKLDAQAGYTYETAIKEDDMAAVLGFRDGIDPTSDESVVAALQSTIDDILFIPGEDGANKLKVEPKNWAFVRECFTSYGGVLSVSIGSPLWTAKLVTEMIYGLLNNAGNKVTK